MENLGVVGCGKMGQALLAKIAPVVKAKITCCDVSEAALEATKELLGDRAVYTKSIGDVAQDCDVVIVAVKPGYGPAVLKRLATGRTGRRILSIMAGIPYQKLCELAPGCEVIRVMPNTPALVGCGSMVVFDSQLSDETRRLVEGMLSQAGFVHFVSNENMMDAVTGLSGSGPAIFAMMVEALADAGVAEGLTRDLARDLARETMLGTAKLLEVQHPAILKENVMSPGGTTAAGVLAAEKAGFRYAAAEFVRAAAQKSRG